jgi:hypothetical protein
MRIKEDKERERILRRSFDIVGTRGEFYFNVVL